jgi:hypothetical protein
VRINGGSIGNPPAGRRTRYAPRAASCAFIAALLLSGQAAAKSPPTLTAILGPGFTVTLQQHPDKPLLRVPAGRYRLVVHDRSAFLDFHFFGPGVNKRTTVTGTGTTTWTIKLRKGIYTYQCDAHANLIHGELRVA